MEHLAPLIESFAGEGTASYVSAGWNRSIRGSNKAILDGARRKYPTKGGSVHETIREALKKNDLSLIRVIMTEYVGYLPIYWIRLIMFVKSKEMAQLILDNTSEEDVQYPLELMIVAFKLGITDMKHMKSNMAEQVFMALNLIDHVSLLNQSKIDQMEGIDDEGEETPFPSLFLEKYTDKEGEESLVLPMKKNTLLWLMEKTKFIDDDKLIADNAEAFSSEYRGMILDMRKMLLENPYGDARSDMISFKVTLLDAYKIYLYLKPHGFEILYNMHGKILSSRIKEGKALSDDEHVSQKYKDDVLRPFIFRYNILSHGVSKGEALALLVRAINDGDDEILDRWLNRENMLSVIAKYGTVIDLFQLLDFKGINPLWFLYFEDASVSKPSDLPPDLWSKYLGNLIVYGSLSDTEDSYSVKSIIARIFKLYTNEITSEKILKMLQLAIKNNRQDMYQWILNGPAKRI